MRRSILLGLLALAFPLPASVSAQEVANPGSVRLAVGSAHVCAHRENRRVLCWGANDQRQLGYQQHAGGSGPSSASDQEAHGLTAVRTITAHGRTTCAVATSGQLLCWGSNSEGHVGVGSDDRYVPIPTAVPGMTSTLSVSLGRVHACALSEDGHVYCWGDNRHGQLGNGSFGEGERASTPVQLEGLGDIISIAAGDWHTCAVRRNGQVACWGRNDLGQLGNGTEGGREARELGPVAVVTASGRGRRARHRPLTGIEEIAAGYGFTCARNNRGRVYCWGARRWGVLGDEPEASEVNGEAIPIAPTQRDFRSTAAELAGIRNAASLFAGPRNACVIQSDQTAVCWGANASRELGDGREHGRLERSSSTSPSAYLAASHEPVQPTGLDSVESISIGVSNLCAATTAGRVLCWGNNEERLIPDRARRVDRPTELTEISSRLSEQVMSCESACGATFDQCVAALPDPRSADFRCDPPRLDCYRACLAGAPSSE